MVVKNECWEIDLLEIKNILLLLLIILNEIQQRDGDRYENDD